MTVETPLEPLAPELQQLAEAGRQGLPSSGQLARVEAALGWLLDTPLAAPRGNGGGNLPLLAKLGALLGVGAAVTVAAVHMLSAPESTETPAVQSPAPRSAEPVPAATSAPPKAAEQPSSIGPARPPAISAPLRRTPDSTPAPAGAVSAKPSESSLLERARQALKQDPRAALALTQQHKRLYPRGVLAQEREVLAIEALSRLNRSEEANRRAGAFKDTYPDSAHREKVRGAQEPQ